MEYSSLTDFLQNFRTAEVLAHIKSLNLGELVHNPWVLGGLGVLALLALVMRYRILLATIVSVTGFVYLFDYTLQREASLENLSDQTLLVFVGGGVFIIFLVIYLLFIKTD